MNTRLGAGGCNLQQQFCLQFQRRMREVLARQCSIAEGFGPAWEATLNDVPLTDEDQAKVYWALISWARGDELFTGACERDLLSAWRETVHEL